LKSFPRLNLNETLLISDVVAVKSDYNLPCKNHSDYHNLFCIQDDLLYMNAVVY